MIPQYFTSVTVVTVSLFFGVGVLSFYLDGRLSALESDTHSADPLYRLIGTVKEGIGDTLFLKADSYYHGGVTTGFQEEPENIEKEGRVGTEEEGDHDHHNPSLSDWISRINQQIKASEHYHLAQDEKKEMLPFLAIATELDPYHVEAILTTAYWLDRHFGKSDSAIELLLKARLNNPNAWEIDYHLAKIYFDRKQDYALSESYFLQAIQKMGEKEKEEMNQHILTDLYYHLAESYLHQGKKEDALGAYQKVLSLYSPQEAIPLKMIVEEKIKSLSQEAP